MAKKPGIVAHKPTPETRERVSELTAFGIPQEYIAQKLGMSVDSLARHYKDELAFGLHHANAQVAGRLFHKAVYQDELQAQVFWLKTRARYREKDPEDTQKYESLVDKLLEKIK